MRFISYFYDYSSSSSTKKKIKVWKAACFVVSTQTAQTLSALQSLRRNGQLEGKNPSTLPLRTPASSLGPHGDVTALMSLRNSRFQQKWMQLYHDIIMIPLYPPSKGFPRFPRLKKTRYSKFQTFCDKSLLSSGFSMKTQDSGLVQK